MTIIHLAYYTILRNFRDVKTLSLMLLLPIMMILILGSALSQVFLPDHIGTTTICILDEDKKEMARALELFLNSEDMTKMIEVKAVQSKEEAFALIKEHTATALVVLPFDFTNNIQSGKMTALEVYSSKYSNLRASIVQSVMMSFIDSTKAQIAVRQMGNTVEGLQRFDNVHETAIMAKGNTPAAIDYYAVTMLVMTIMYGAAYGNFSIKEENQLNTNIRLASAPISYWEVVLGKLLGSIVTVFMQGLMIILFTKLVYKVNWGDNLLLVIFICFSLTMLSIGLGIMVSNLGRNPQATGALLNFGVNITTFIAGGYFPVNQMSPTLEKIGAVSPNYLAHRAIFNTIYGGSSAQTINYILIIWISALVAFIIAGLTERRAAN